MYICHESVVICKICLILLILFLDSLTFWQNTKYTCQTNKGLNKLFTFCASHQTSDLPSPHHLLFKQDRKLYSLWIPNNPRLVLKCKYSVKTLKHSLSMSFTLIHIYERLQIEMFSLLDKTAEGLRLSERRGKNQCYPCEMSPYLVISTKSISALKKPTSDPGS